MAIERQKAGQISTRSDRLDHPSGSAIGLLGARWPAAASSQCPRHDELPVLPHLPRLRHQIFERGELAGRFVHIHNGQQRPTQSGVESLRLPWLVIVRQFRPHEDEQQPLRLGLHRRRLQQSLEIVHLGHGHDHFTLVELTGPPIVATRSRHESWISNMV